jgi:hypothetical protein
VNDDEFFDAMSSAFAHRMRGARPCKLCGRSYEGIGSTCPLCAFKSGTSWSYSSAQGGTSGSSTQSSTSGSSGYSRPAPPKPKTLDIDAEMIRRLIQLCHPDKHNGSEASVKATHFLLELRKQLP